jgi:hypothetical protein
MARKKISEVPAHSNRKQAPPKTITESEYRKLRHLTVGLRGIIDHLYELSDCLEFLNDRLGRERGDRRERNYRERVQ